MFRWLIGSSLEFRFVVLGIAAALVVIATSIFFGFYLWGLDLAFSRALSFAFKRQF